MNRPEEIRLLVSQLIPQELAVVGLRYGLNSARVHMSYSQIVQATGWPMKGVLDAERDAFRKLGSALSRVELQQITGKKLTPRSLALKAREEHTQKLRQLRQASLKVQA